MNFLAAIPDHGHVQFERQYNLGNLLGRLGHPAHNRQIDRSQEESRRVVDESGPAKVHLLATLGDHHDARMVRRPAGTGRRSSPVKAHARNLCYPILFLTHKGGNLAREFCARPAGRVCFRGTASSFLVFFMVGDL